MSPTVPTTVTVFAARHRPTAWSPDARSAVPLSPEWWRVRPPGGRAAGRHLAPTAAYSESIAAMPGFIGLTLSRQIEHPNLYLLLAPIV